MGLLKALFGGKDEGQKRGQGTEADPLAELVAEIRQEGSDGPPVADIGADASPKQVCRYVFQRLVAGDPASRLRADLVGRGLSAKVADAYIEVIQKTMLGGR